MKKVCEGRIKSDGASVRQYIWLSRKPSLGK